jgi:hypothetical protein
MAYTCNLSYSRGGDQENHGSKLAYTNSTPISEKKKKSQKKGLAE